MLYYSPKHSTTTSGSVVPSPISKIPLSSTSSSASSRPSSQMSGKMFPSSTPVAGSNTTTRKSSSPTTNGGNLQTQVAGSEMRPGSYAAPPNTIGLPSVPSPLPSSSSTSSSKSQNSKIQQPGSGIPKLNLSHNGKKSPIQQRVQQAPPPPLKLRQETMSNVTTNNGLLSTIEQAAHSDEEPTSPPALPPCLPTGTMFPSTTKETMSTPPRTSRSSAPSRVPLASRETTASPQPNYENISTPVSKQSSVGLGFTTGIPKLGSPIGYNKSEPTVTGLKRNLQNTQSDRISTAQFVATSKRDISSNNSIPAKKAYLHHSGNQARSPSPKVTSTTTNSARLNSPVSSNPRMQSTNSPAMHSNSGIPINKAAPSIGAKNPSLTSSRIPMPK